METDFRGNDSIQTDNWMDISDVVWNMKMYINAH